MFSNLKIPSHSCISSFHIFRYTQCVAMTRFYKRPILLIEFDPTKSFSLQVCKQNNTILIQFNVIKIQFISQVEIFRYIYSKVFKNLMG